MDIFDLALAMTPHVGDITIGHLIKRFHSAEAIFSQSVDQLTQQGGLNKRAATAIASREGMGRAEAQIQHCQRHNIAILCANDPEYPTLLRSIHSAPYILYVQGNVEVLNNNLISMVGTRRISPYGDRCCSELVKQIGEQIDRAAIVSGLAFGVDAAAHRAALSNDIPTIAVVPTPLPDITPGQHRDLAQRILDSGGALVSEIRAGVSTGANGFISRNRIIAGLSQATIIVESTIKGGAMATAEIAISNNRMVGAVPGRITDSTSVGCNHLISRRGATAITSADDLVHHLNWHDQLRTSTIEPRDERVEQEPTRSDEEARVLRAFADGQTHHISELERTSGLDASQLGAVLMTLELVGDVRMLPGSIYERLTR